MPTQYGESVVMRLLNQGGTTLRLDAIGMPPKLVQQFRAIVSRPNGLVLVTGPTGSGKTTTLYCALSELNSVEKSSSRWKILSSTAWPASIRCK
ncbi:Type II traffic warden ATPase [Janthinobacterium lividum]|nr:Type II traffic warden ATPase [Janthinobacterium lividum]